MARGDTLYTYWLATAPVLSTPTEIASLGPNEEWVILEVAQGNLSGDYRTCMSFLVFWTDPSGNFGQFGAMSSWSLINGTHIGKTWPMHVVVPPNATIFALVKDQIFEPELSFYGYKLVYASFPPLLAASRRDSVLPDLRANPQDLPPSMRISQRARQASGLAPTTEG